MRDLAAIGAVWKERATSVVTCWPVETEGPAAGGSDDGDVWSLKSEAWSGRGRHEEIGAVDRRVVVATVFGRLLLLGYKPEASSGARERCVVGRGGISSNSSRIQLAGRPLNGGSPRCGLPPVLVTSRPEVIREPAVVDGRTVAEGAEEDAAGPLDEESCVLSGQPVSHFGTIVRTLRRLRARTLGVRDLKYPCSTCSRWACELLVPGVRNHIGGSQSAHLWRKSYEGASAELMIWVAAEARPSCESSSLPALSSLSSRSSPALRDKSDINELDRRRQRRSAGITLKDGWSIDNSGAGALAVGRRREERGLGISPPRHGQSRSLAEDEPEWTPGRIGQVMSMTSSP
jgi:hypothetical protein